MHALNKLKFHFENELNWYVYALQAFIFLSLNVLNVSKGWKIVGML